MHIVFDHPKVLPVKEYGGIERVVVWLTKGLHELGHMITFIGPHGSAVPHCRNVSFPCVDVRVPSPDQLRGLIPENADILHFNHGSLVEHDYGIPFLVTVHGAIKDFRGLNERYCFISYAQRRYWGYAQNPVVHHGLDQDEYIYREAKDDYFLFLSRIDWDVKGVNWAIEVAVRTGVRLIIAGNAHRYISVNSYGRGYLKKKLSDRIQYVGPVGGELKAMLLAKAKALIFPTQWC